MRIGFLFLLCSFSLVAQDSYHQELVNEFVSENNLNPPSYVFGNTEAGNISSMYTYGSVSLNVADVQDFDFSKLLTYNVPSIGANQWDAGTGMNSKATIIEDDIVVFTFWAKRNGSQAEVQFFVEDGVTYDKEFYETIDLTPDWNQYFVAIQANKDYPIGRLVTGFHVASMVQEFELGGLTAFNFGGIEIEDVPSTFGTGVYEGVEADSPWRATAAERIEEFRKAELVVNVLDKNGSPVADAEVRVEMQEHEFKFGSAFVTCRFPGNNCYDQTYVDKISNLDGKGHGFNAGVTENGLKWDGWEEEWLGTPAEAISAVKYLSDNGVQMRGHTLVWPGYGNMPEDILANKNDLGYIRDRLSERIDEMILNSELSGAIREWDVLNEITQNRDLEAIFMADPDFTTGREIYQEIMAEVRAKDPDLKLYINDYVVLSGGGSNSAVVGRYKEYLDEIHNSNQPFDGIGFQGHIGANPTSILKAEAVFDEFWERYGKKMSVTEYDISDVVDAETQASYMADFLTLTFSHPSMDAFLMWGFWDGNHWKQNAPMYDINWNLKPSGQAFVDKVFGEWWTEETLSSSEDGRALVNGFKGRYKIFVSKDGESSELEVSLSEASEINIELSGLSSLENILDQEISILPTAVTEGTFSITSDSSNNFEKVSIFDVSGKLLNSYSNVLPDQVMEAPSMPGSYLVNIKTNEGAVSKKIQVFR